MYQAFDPYHRFLGIPPHLQPPNHYRLLGLELFERDPDVISDAADRQMAHVRRYQTGDYSAYTEPLLNELAAAKVCLLLPERKAAYDTELRKLLATSAAPVPFSPQEAKTPRHPMLHDEDEEISIFEVDLPPAPSSPSSTKRIVASNTPGSGISLDRPLQGSGSGLNRPSSIGSGIRKTAVPPSVASLPVTPSSGYALGPAPTPPVDPTTYEPPFMAEYRRRFFETLLKVLIFAFLLVILLLLFNTFVLPWLKSVHVAPAPIENNKATVPDKPKGHTTPPSPEVPKMEKRSDAPGEDGQSTLPELPANKNDMAESEPVEGRDFFLGTWHIYEDGRYTSSITLYGNDAARDSRYHESGGRWSYQNDQARILWKDGWQDILERKGDKTKKHSFAPGDIDERKPVNEGTASKSEKTPEE